MIPGNLARCIFNKKCSQHNLDRTLEFFRLADKLYNPSENENNFLNYRDILDEIPQEENTGYMF